MVYCGALGWNRVTSAAQRRNKQRQASSNGALIDQNKANENFRSCVGIRTQDYVPRIT